MDSTLSNQMDRLIHIVEGVVSFQNETFSALEGTSYGHDKFNYRKNPLSKRFNKNIAFWQGKSSPLQNTRLTISIDHTNYVRYISFNDIERLEV